MSMRYAFVVVAGWVGVSAGHADIRVERAVGGGAFVDITGNVNPIVPPSNDIVIPLNESLDGIYRFFDHDGTAGGDPLTPDEPIGSIAFEGGQNLIVLIGVGAEVNPENPLLVAGCTTLTSISAPGNLVVQIRAVDDVGVADLPLVQPGSQATASIVRIDTIGDVVGDITHTSLDPLFAINCVNLVGKVRTQGARIVSVSGSNIYGEISAGVEIMLPPVAQGSIGSITSLGVIDSKIVFASTLDSVVGSSINGTIEYVPTSLGQELPTHGVGLIETTSGDLSAQVLVPRIIEGDTIRVAGSVTANPRFSTGSDRDVGSSSAIISCPTRLTKRLPDLCSGMTRPLASGLVGR